MNQNTTLDKIYMSKWLRTALEGMQIFTAGELLALDPVAFSGQHGVGKKIWNELVYLQNELRNMDLSDGETAGEKYPRGDARARSVGTIGLSGQAVRCLLRNNVYTVGEMLCLSHRQIRELNGARKTIVEEILKKKAELNRQGITVEGRHLTRPEVDTLLASEQYRDRVIGYLKTHDVRLASLPGLSEEVVRMLEWSNMNTMSDLIIAGREEQKAALLRYRSRMKQSDRAVDDYLNEHGRAISLCCHSPEKSKGVNLWGVQNWKDFLMQKVFHDIGFRGLCFQEILAGIPLKAVSGEVEENVRKAVESLIADGKLEVVDSVCYRRYISFPDYVRAHSAGDERNAHLLLCRLEGKTLNKIGQEAGLSIANVRWLTRKSVKKYQGLHTLETGNEFFDEDRYVPFFTTYAFDRKNCMTWLGISQQTWSYLNLAYTRGKRDVCLAVDDDTLDEGLRQKIRGCLRQKQYVSGRRRKHRETLLS